MTLSRVRNTLLVLLTLAPRGLPQTTTIDFDGVPAPGAFHQVPPGFGNGPHLDFPEVTLDGGVILSDVLFGHTATSGKNIYATCDTCGLGDTPPTGLPGKVIGAFKQDVDQIDIDVINGFGGSGANFTLTAFDRFGAVAASQTVATGPAGGANPTGHLAVAAAGLRAFEVTTGLSLGYTFATDTLVFRLENSPFTDLGGGVAGSHGVAPRLVGHGTLVAGTTTGLDLTDAMPSAATLLIVSPNALGAPFSGGTLWPDPTPPGVIAATTTTAAGALKLQGAWPPGIPSGATLYLQAFIADAAAAAGASASNGLSAVAP